MSAPALRPRAVTEVLDAAFQLYRSHFTALTTLTAIAFLPIVVVSAVFGVGAAAMAESGSGDDVSAAAAGAALLVMFLVPLLVGWFLLAEAALHRAVADAYLGEPVSVSAALRAVKPRFWHVVGATIIKGLIVVTPLFAGLILIGIAGAADLPALAAIAVLALIIVMGALFLRLALIPATVVLEDNRAGAAARRAWELTAGHVWRMFGAAFLAYLILAVLQLTVLGIVTLLSNFQVGQIAMNLSSIVTYPIVAAVMVLMYYDLRIRKEGFDLEVMSADLARLPEPPGAAAAPAAAEAVRRIR